MIQTPFEAGYERLRHDFNRALTALSDIMGTIADSSTRINGGSAGIARSSDDLFRRTESSAATLYLLAAVAQFTLGGLARRRAVE